MTSSSNRGASASESNAPYYAAFLALMPEQRRGLLERVEIFDGVLRIAEVQPLLERAVRKSVKPQRRAALIDRLRGWWHKRAIAHLDAVARGLPDRIGAGELESELLEIADALRDENLPIDVLDMAEPSEQEVSESDRIFVAQLRLVALSSERLRKCIYDHNRAFAQRSRWQRDRLLEVGELSRTEPTALPSRPWPARVPSRLLTARRPLSHSLSQTRPYRAVYGPI